MYELCCVSTAIQDPKIKMLQVFIRQFDHNDDKSTRHTSNHLSWSVDTIKFVNVIISMVSIVYTILSLCITLLMFQNPTFSTVTLSAIISSIDEAISSYPELQSSSMMSTLCHNIVSKYCFIKFISILIKI